MLTKQRQDRYFRIFLASAAFLFAYLLLFRLPFTPIFIESDHLIPVYEGLRLLNGDVMYRDFFEFTTPGAPAFYAAIFSIFGEKYYLLSLTIITLAIATTLLTFEISHRTIAGPLRFLPSLGWLFFGFRWFGLDGSHRMFSPLFVFIAIVMLLKGRAKTHLIVAGIFLGLASAFTQQRGLVALIAFALFLFIENYAKHAAVKGAITDILWIFLAFVITFALTAGYFIWAAGTNNFIFDTVIYPLKFYGYAPANGYGVFISDIAKAASMPGLSGKLFLVVSVFYAWLLPAVIIASIFVVARRMRRATWETFRATLFLATVSLLMFASTVGPNTIRFFQIGVPVLVLLCWVTELSPAVRKIEWRLVAAVATILLVVGISQAVRLQTNWNFRYVNTPSGTLAFMTPEQAEFYADLSSRTHPGEAVYESVQPYIYFPLSLRNPTKLAQVWPYDYTRPEQVAGVIADLQNSRPQLIVWDNSNNKPDDQRAAGDHLGALAEYVNANYAPSGPVYSLEGHELQVYQVNKSD